VRLSAKQVVASVAGAVLAALALSCLGAGGTIIGVAIGSAAATIGSALAFHSLERGHEKVKEFVAPVVAATTKLPPSSSSPSVVAPSIPPYSVSVEDGHRLGGIEPARPAPAPLRSAPKRKGPRWPVVAVVALVFAISLGVVTIIELSIGKPLSTVTTGTASNNATSVGDILGRSDTTTSTSTTTSTTTTTTSRPTTTTSTTSTTTTTTTSSASTTTTVPPGASTTTSVH